MTQARKSGWYRVTMPMENKITEWEFAYYDEIDKDWMCIGRLYLFDDSDFLQIDETPIPNIPISTIKETLNRAQCELQAMYKRTGIKGSNVLDEINKLYDSL